MPTSTSFPSGHTASAFAFALAVSRTLPGLALPLVPLAAAVGYSRVHTGVHYPGDVLAGADPRVGGGRRAAPRSRRPPGPRDLAARLGFLAKHASGSRCGPRPSATRVVGTGERWLDGCRCAERTRGVRPGCPERSRGRYWYSASAGRARM